jgi:hypothetical protein
MAGSAQAAVGKLQAAMGKALQGQAAAMGDVQQQVRAGALGSRSVRALGGRRHWRRGGWEWWCAVVVVVGAALMARQRDGAWDGAGSGGAKAVTRTGGLSPRRGCCAGLQVDAFKARKQAELGGLAQQFAGVEAAIASVQGQLQEQLRAQAGVAGGELEGVLQQQGQLSQVGGAARGGGGGG